MNKCFMLTNCKCSTHLSPAVTPAQHHEDYQSTHIACAMILSTCTINHHAGTVPSPCLNDYFTPKVNTGLYTC